MENKDFGVLEMKTCDGNWTKIAKLVGPVKVTAAPVFATEGQNLDGWVSVGSGATIEELFGAKEHK